MRMPKQFLIEGVDRMGKGTLIEGILQTMGYHVVVHLEKPRKLKVYDDCTPTPLRLYQHDVYTQMFKMIDSGIEVIFDRAHLGEMVYAPLYRKYSGNYVLDYEKDVATHDARLILLTTSDFSFIQDDGLSLDFSKKEIEQAKFIEAFSQSTIEDKVIIDVCNGKGGYRPAAEILEAALRR